MKIVISGAATSEDIPGLREVATNLDIIFAPDQKSLGEALSEAEVLLGWDFQTNDMQGQWHLADKLKWIHWCGASVDRIMSPELTASDIKLTNARGIFDLVMTEYVLGYMLVELKRFRETFQLQSRKQWTTRLTGKLAGSNAVIFGVGSIGREMARLLRAVGVNVSGVGRRKRLNDPDFGTIFTSEKARDVLQQADWVIGLLPLTPETNGYFDSAFFSRMSTHARFINLGRGESVDEEALITALDQGKIAGAMLDVFHNEPPDANRPSWYASNIVISPHTSSYYGQYQEDMASQFIDNLTRYERGEPLMNLVDTTLGFVTSET